MFSCQVSHALLNYLYIFFLVRKEIWSLKSIDVLICWPVAVRMIEEKKRLFIDKKFNAFLSFIDFLVLLSIRLSHQSVQRIVAEESVNDTLTIREMTN